MILQEQQQGWRVWLDRWFYPLLIVGIAANASALFITILEPDGALYASIARTMATTGDFINMQSHGRDWLDKPHFPFWITAFSYKVFGINTFAYKFPALLFWGMGAWFTWRFAKYVYGRTEAQLATLIYVSAAHLVISNNDVRAEPYLTGLVIGSVYYFYRTYRRHSAADLVAGSLLSACAVMTKGPFVLITIAAGFVLEWVLRGEWRQFLQPRWWIALLLIAIFIMPELYSLYVQFDLHPEKVVFGRTGVSGIRFFFWDSQFGRFFNTGPIKGSGDPFFYFHTLLWAFLPWSLLLYAAFVTGIIAALKRWESWKEFVTLGASLATFIVFSLSRFQLPHYLNMLFPFFSILTAHFLYHVYRSRSTRLINIMFYVITIVLVLLLFLIAALFGFSRSTAIYAGLAVATLLLFLLFRGAGILPGFGRCFGAAMIVYCFVNLLLYPALLKYQSGSVAARAIAERLRWRGPVYMPTEYPASYSLQFYLPQVLQYRSIQEINGPALLFVPQRSADSLVRDSVYTPLLKVPHFHVSQLTGEFINHRTRAQVLDTNVVLLKK